jgi:hypothetical protein
MNPHKFLPCGCFVDFTGIEFNQILIKHDNSIGTRIKEMRGPSTTNQYLLNPELLLSFTFLFLDELFPNTTQKIK